MSTAPASVSSQWLRRVRRSLCCSVIALLFAANAPAQEPITAPVPRSETAVPYPATGVGRAEVLLELLVTAEGTVAEVQVIQGDAPFAIAASEAARAWRFQPAERAGAAVSARIRFMVKFEPPPPSLPAPTPAPAETPAPQAPPTPRAIDVEVLGERPHPSTTSLGRAEVRQLPGAFGDPFRAIEVLPGITPLVSGLPYFFVRGAPPGNVGYFLDGVRVPLLYHFGLGPSVVHPGLVDRVDLYPGGYPARYGRYAGAIVAGETLPPADQLRGEYNVRVFDAGVLVDTPLLDGRAGLLLGGRYSYTAAALSLLSPDVLLEYWDYQARAHFDLDGKNTLSAFAFGSYDYLGEKRRTRTEQLFNTQFHRVDLRFDHAASETTDLRLAATLGIDVTGGGDEFFVRDRLINVRSELEHRADAALVRAGFDLGMDVYDVRPPEGEDDDDVFDRLFPTREDIATGVWTDVRIAADRNVTVTPGLRADVYASDGATAVGVEPRVSARFQVQPKFALLHTFGIAHQPPSFVVPVPGFAVGGLRGGLQRSIQASSGCEWQLPGEITASVTLFDAIYLNMNDALGAARGQDDDDDPPEEPDGAVFERRSLGSSYGLELYVRRSLTRRLGGSVSYTLSRSVRSLGREHFPSSFDRTHVLHLVAAYDLGRNWRAGSRFTFYSGFPEDDPDSGLLRREHPSRVPNFYRIDLRLEKKWRLGERSWIAFVAEMLNATLNKEVVDVSCSTAGGCANEEVGPVSLPSIGVEGGF